MGALKDLRINGLKDLKVNGLKYLRISELKCLVHNLGNKGDTEIEDLIKSEKEIEIKISKLFREKRGIESRLGQLQKTEEGKSEEIFEFPLREEIFPPLRRNIPPEASRLLEVETDDLQGEDSGVSKRIDSKNGKKVKIADKFLESKETDEIEGGNVAEIEIKEKAKSASEKNDVKSNEVTDSSNIRSDEVTDFSNIRKKTRKIVFSENTDKIKNIYPSLEEDKTDEDEKSEKIITESEKPEPGFFGNSLIEELLESEDLYPEKQQSFMKYIGESSVTELITELRDIKKLLT